MAEREFLAVFKRYNPSEEKRALLRRAGKSVFRYSKDPMRVEVELSFDSHEDAELLYEIEDECRTLYEAESFRIFPHFPASEFSQDRLGEIVYEAALCGAVTHGFFSEAVFSDDGETIKVSLPFNPHGINFVKDANTEQILSTILKSRYSVDRKFLVCEGEGAERYEAELERRRGEILDRVERENREQFARDRETAAREREAAARAADPHYDFTAKAGISSLTGFFERISENVYRIGAHTYDISEPEAVFGDDFDVIEPTPLADADKARATTVFLGTVFDVTTKEVRGGERINCIIGISDGASGIYARRMQDAEEIGWIKGLKPGAHVAVFGKVFDSDFVKR